VYLTTIDYVPENGVNKIYWLPLGYSKCNQRAGLVGFTIIETQYIVLCPFALTASATVGDTTYDYSHAQHAGITIDHMSITISGTLFHEFLHLLFYPISKFSF
jgi:hypothetical protein